MLVGILALLGYASRLEGGKPDPNVLYHWSTAAFGLVQDAVVLALVLAIAWRAPSLLALRLPRSAWTAVLFVAAAVVAIYVFEGIYAHLVDPGNEQGLTPDRWEPAHAAAYVGNAIVISTWVPFVEELTFRGSGQSLLRFLGRAPSILLVGIVFGLAHGLVEALLVLVPFGIALAWLRDRTGSVVPGMLVHALFNGAALALIVVG